MMVNDVMIFSWGLRGGPFEVRKRRLVVWGMYAQFFLMLAFLGFAIFGTVFVTSDIAAKECWSRRPCSSITELVPDACLSQNLNSFQVWTRYGRNTTTELTPACVELEALWQEGTVGQCAERYLDLAGQYQLNALNRSASEIAGKPVFRPEVRCRAVVSSRRRVFESLDAGW